MASFHLCHCKSTIQSKPHPSINPSPPPTMLSSQAALLSKSTPNTTISANLNRFRLKSIRPKHTHIFNRFDASIEPSFATHEQPLTIGIVGFGNFGQFIAKGLKRQGHNVLATSRSDYSDYCQQHGIEYFRDIDGMCSKQPDVILICSSILSTESLIRKIPIQKLKSDTIFADVLSVKQFPRNLFLEVLPPGFGIICTHPMFGPESGKRGWGGLPFVYDKVRITDNSIQARKCEQFLGVFENEGCRMVEMSCEEHDRHAAGSQFITHTIGRILSHLDLESTPINTKGYETLLQLTENTVSDSFDLYYGLFMYNVNATEQIENLDRAFETVKQKLFGRLHDILRKQIVERVPMQDVGQKQVRESSPARSFLPKSEDMSDLTSFAVPPPPHDHKDEAVPIVAEAAAR